MNIVIAIDSFKGSLTSLEAGQALAEGITRALPSASLCVRPLADGGEGTVEALVSGMDGVFQQVTVTGPMGDPVTCTYGIIEKKRTAILEMSAAAGLTLVPEEQRNPMLATTFGVGEMILDAIRKGCRKFLVGIGGSATNDGGVGMLQALGYEFLDKDGKDILPGAQGLKDLAEIRTQNVLPQLKECTFRIACDVRNPLCGDQGCSAIFGPQKGASGEMIRDMDIWLSQYAALAKKTFPKANPDFPGTGAAGGLGFAFLTFVHGTLEPGIQMILEETGLEEEIKQADFVITGEGQLDGQTVMGKAPAGVASLAKKWKKPVIAFSGSVTPEATLCNQKGIDAFFPILRKITTLEKAMEPETARENLAAAAEQVFRLIHMLQPS
ncbi:MAG: glycerate kinase [Oliverpabstia sp.]|nr:glycerate kinase [Oliverpabstia sp.]